MRERENKQVFAYKPYLKWPVTIGALIMIYIFSYSIWLGLRDQRIDEGELILTIISIIMILIFGLCILELWRTKLILDQNKLTYRNWRGIWTIHAEEIDHVEKKVGFYRLWTKKGLRPKKVDIGDSFLKIDELLDWCGQGTRLVLQTPTERDEEELLKDKELGKNEEEKIKKISMAYIVFTILELSAYVLLIWSFVVPRFEHGPLLISLLIYPFVLLLTASLHSKAVIITGQKNSNVAQVSRGFVFTSFALGLRSFVDIPLFSYWDIVHPLIALSVCMIVLFLKTVTIHKSYKWQSILLIVLISVVYSFGALVSMNSVYDKDEAKIYKAKVTSKWVSSGKDKSFILYVERWGNKEGPVDFHVEQELYNRMEVGETLKIFVHPGYLKIPWLSVRKY